MLERVYEKALNSELATEVYIVTDHRRVTAIASEIGAKFLMSDPSVPSGTARIASVINDIEGDLIVNLQADLPLIDPTVLDELIESFVPDQMDMITPIFRIYDEERLQDPNTVKVVFTRCGRALYFSRAQIPFINDKAALNSHSQEVEFWGHLGIYGYKRAILENFLLIGASSLEEAESLEQLRFLQNGIQIFTVRVKTDTISVDTYRDLERVRKIMIR